MTWKFTRIVVLCCGPYFSAAAADRSAVTGRVVDASGKAVEHATVMVYAAGVKVGYSTHCPTCYVDCGKRALTDASGKFSMNGLASDLWFRLLVAREGSMPVFVMKVDPAAGQVADTTLPPAL